MTIRAHDDVIATILRHIDDPAATAAFAAGLTIYPGFDQQAFLAAAGYTPTPRPVELTAADIETMTLRVDDPRTCQAPAQAAA